MAHGELYPLSDPAARKAQIVARMQAQRELWQLNRAAAYRAEAAAEEAAGAGADDVDSPSGASVAGRLTRNPAVRLAVAHPLAAAGIAGVMLMLGPRRLLRMSAWLLPLILRR